MTRRSGVWSGFFVFALLGLLLPQNAAAVPVVVGFQGVMDGGWIGSVNAPVAYSGTFGFESSQSTLQSGRYVLGSLDLQIGSETVPTTSGWIRLGLTSFELTAPLTGTVGGRQLDSMRLALYGDDLLPAVALPDDASFAQRADFTRLTVVGSRMSESLYDEPGFGPSSAVSAGPNSDPIPEPAALLCFAIGLGIVGFSVRSRTTRSAA